MDSRTLTLLHSSRLSVEECIAAQQAIDAEIREILPSSPPESARKLRMRRNSYALFNAWLPPELIVTIFHEIAVTTRNMPWFYVISKDFPDHNFSRTWVAVSHVCQNWRVIAIGTPELWRRISIVNPDVTAIMLHRSIPLPIIIGYHSWSSKPEPISTLAIALSQSDRASEIRLNMYPAGLQALIPEHMTKPMPLLKRLELRTPGRYRAMQDFFLPPGCLERMTALNHLFLYAVGFSPTSILPATLTELDMHQLPEKFTPSLMAAVLEPLESLRVLYIDDALHREPPDPPVPGDPRRMSPRRNLVRFHINTTAWARNAFMSQFSVTPTTQITLHCSPDTLEDVRFGEVLRPLYGARGFLRHLLLSFAYGITIIGYASASLTPSETDMCFRLFVLPDDGFIFPPDETLRDLCKAIPLDGIETLVIESPDDQLELAEVMAQLLASHVSGVRTLWVEIDVLKSMLRVMQPQTDEHGPGFPALRSLTVHDGPSLRSLTVHDGYGPREVNKDVLHPIVDCLVARKQSGKTTDLEELVINGCRAPPELLQDAESLRSWESPPLPIDSSAAVTGRW